MTASESGKDLVAALAQQHERLEQLRTWEHELKILDEIEAELEVEKIGADVALNSANAKQTFGIDPGDAAAVAESLMRKRELERAMISGGDSPSGDRTDSEMEAARLRAAMRALGDWLGATESAARWRRPKTAYGFVGIASVITLVAAISVHPMLLVLLVPLAMALGYLAFTERDADWIRLGAVRHFQQAGVPPPLVWNDSEVRSRLDELETALAETESSAREPVDPDRPEPDESQSQDASELDMALELVKVNDEFGAALRKVGIQPDQIDDQLGDWLQKIYHARRIDADLTEAKTKRVILSRSAEEHRDAIFRFLALNDAAPAQGRADIDSLRAGLTELASRGRQS